MQNIKQTMNQAINRIKTIDIIRSIALLGILIFNIQTYALFTFLTPEQVYKLGLDSPEIYAPLQFLLHIFVNGQFYTIYSFLFGLGFYLLYQKNIRQGLDAGKIFKRRLWILLLIGLVHGLVFWFGDILHKYGIFGFTLLYFNKKSVRSIVKWIIGLMTFSFLLQILISFINPAAPKTLEINPIIMEVVQTWQHGSIGAVFSLQKLGVAMLWVMNVENGLSSNIHYLCMFLLGLIAGKMDVFNRIPEFKNKLLKSALIIFPILILIKAITNFDILGIKVMTEIPFQFRELIFKLMIFITTPFITICYLIFFSVLFSNTKSAVFDWIGNTGKLGLTNYLMQTLLCMILFYGYAFGLSGKTTLLETTFYAILIYIFQVIYSNIWLKYFKTGPVENLWRLLSKSK